MKIFVRQMHRFILVSVWIAISGASAFSQVGSLPLVSKIPNPPGVFNNYRSAALQDGRAYCGIDNQFRIYDVSDIAHPAFLGAYVFPNNTYGVLTFALSETLALVPGWGATNVLDLSDPTNPTLASSSLPFAFGVQMSGTLAYLATSAGLKVVDISNPRAPVMIGQYSTQQIPNRLAVSGSHVFLVEEHFGVEVVNVSNPAQPEYAGAYAFPQQTFSIDIVVSDSIAYLAEGSHGFHVLDVSDPTSPVLIANVTTTGLRYIDRLALSGSILFISGEQTPAEAWDVSDPRVPVLKGLSSSKVWAEQIGAQGPYVIMPTNNIGAPIFQFTDNGPIVTPTPSQTPSPHPTFSPTPSPSATPGPVNVQFLGSLSGSYQAVAVVGDVAYLGGGQDIYLADVGDPSNPTTTFFHTFGGTISSIAISGATAAVGSDQLYLLNISDPQNPTIIGSYTTKGPVLDVALSGNYAYTAEKFYINGYLTGENETVDISNPASPVLVQENYGRFSVVTVSGNRSYLSSNMEPAIGGDYPLGTQSTLVSFDISDPENQVMACSQTATLGWFSDVAVSGSIVAVGNTSYNIGGSGGASSRSSIKFFDDSPCQTPISTISSNDRPLLSFSGSLLFEGGGYGQRMRVLDVSNFHSPFEVGSYYRPFTSIATAGTTAYLATYSGFVILQYTGPVPTPSPTPAVANDAQLAGQFIPSDIPMNHALPVQITFQNIGNTIWNSASGYGLAVVEDANSLSSPTLRIPLDSLDQISPGQQHTFSFNLYGPDTPGVISTITFQMIQEGVGNFGPVVQASLNVVEAQNGAQLMRTTLPSRLNSDESVGIGVTMRNTGNTTWISSADAGAIQDTITEMPPPTYSLGVLQDGCLLMGGMSLVPVPATDGPNQNCQFVFFIHAPAASQNCTLRMQMVETHDGTFKLFGEAFELNANVGPAINAAVDWAVYE